MMSGRSFERIVELATITLMVIIIGAVLAGWEHVYPILASAVVAVMIARVIASAAE